MRARAAIGMVGMYMLLFGPVLRTIDLEQVRGGRWAGVLQTLSSPVLTFGGHISNPRYPQCRHGWVRRGKSGRPIKSTMDGIIVFERVS
jgi:hypothetical protein